LWNVVSAKSWNWVVGCDALIDSYQMCPGASQELPPMPTDTR
jgi:hypothetical protein